MARDRQPLIPPREPSRMVGGGWTGVEVRRTISFLMAVLCGLASGSNYGYSAYAPQLASQLHLSSTHINLVGTAGNLGMYLSGPVWGKIVDSRGQRIPLLVGGLLVFSGYAVVHSFFTLSIPIRSDPADPPSPFALFFLAFAMFLTGCGGSAGLSASINAVAKSFSDKTRASMTGTVLAGFGLSAFAFSTLGHFLFGGDGGGLLLLLAFGTGVPLFAGSFIVQPVPPQHENGYEPLDDSEVLIDDEEIIHGSSADIPSRIRSGSLELSRSTSLDIARAGSLSPAPRGRAHSHRLSDAGVGPKLDRSKYLAIGASYSPYQLVHLFDFWLLFAILAILCGTGLMYINNAGTVALALARDGKLEYDKKVISTWQAKQVATVSIWNCAGRILGGVASDFSKTRFGVQRIWFLPLIAVLFIISQIAGLDTTDVSHLWIVSTILGLAYGGLFNILPMLVLEWFGMPNFSQNFGWTCVAPIIGGNVFNLLFGRVYDSNTLERVGSPNTDSFGVEALRGLIRRAGNVLSDDAKHDCLVGTACYAPAFRFSTLCCFVAFFLSVFAGFRRERALRNKRRGSTIEASHR